MAVGLLFFLILGSEVGGFLQAFFNHQRDAGHSDSDWLRSEWAQPQNIFKVALLPLFGVILAMRKIARSGFSFLDAAFLLALLLGFYATLNSITGNRLLGLISVLGIFGYLIASGPTTWRARALVSLAALAFGLSIARPFLEGLTCEKPSAAEIANLKNRLGETSFPRLVVDWWSWRYLFDYRIDPGMVYAGSSARPAFPDGSLRLYPDECWVVSADTVDFFGLKDPHLPQPRYLRIGGKPAGHWVINAGEIGFSPPGPR